MELEDSVQNYTHTADHTTTIAYGRSIHRLTTGRAYTMSEDEKKIILITDLVDQRLRKEQEIEYYEKELLKIKERLGYLYKEKTLTETILAIIQTEKVVDIKEYMQAKLEKKE